MYRNLIIFLLALFILDGKAQANSENTSITETPTTPMTSSTTTNESSVTTEFIPTAPSTHPSIKSISVRAAIVVAAICGLVIVYFVLRTVCSRHRRNRNRRYGMLKENRRGNSNMEMRPLSEGDDDDDEDDLTLFDASQRILKR